MATCACALLATAACHDVSATDVVLAPPDCNDAGFTAALTTVDASGSGTLTFDCGTATIAIASYKQIANAVTIDGGGTITLDGGGTSPFLQVFFSANVTLRGLTFQHGMFGDVHPLESFGTLMLDHVRVLDNVSDGSAVANYGTLTVRSSTFSNNANTRTDFNGDGGAIVNSSGTLDVADSTFDGNSSGRYGGAVFSDLSMTVLNSTFDGNTAFGGAALYQTGSGTSFVEFTTIIDNIGTAFGGGVYNEGSASATLTLSRSVLIDNAGGNCDGVLTSSGYNLWHGTTQCPFNADGDAAATDATFGALADNGGPTLTRLPGTGNSAIDHVPSNLCQVTADQRGVPRPFGTGCDSGAVEVAEDPDVVFTKGFD